MENTNFVFNTLAAQLHLQPEQLIAVVQAIQNQVIPAQPVEREKTQEELRAWVDSPECEAQRKAALEKLEERTIDLSKLKSGKYDPLKNGDASCVDSEEDFKQALLYEKLYENGLSEELVQTLEYDLKKIAKKIGKTDLATYFKNRCETKKQEVRQRKEREEKEKSKLTQRQGYKTNFTNLPDFCDGNKFVSPEWTATNQGIYCIEDNGKTVRRTVACGRPVLVNRLLNPMDDKSGPERVEIVYLGDTGWKKLVCSRGLLLNANRAMELADAGVAINSDRARAFTNFMTSMLEESTARDAIKKIPSSAKLALMKDGKIILPYLDDNYVFEGENKMPQLVESLRPHGDRAAWYEKFKWLRSTKQTFFEFAVASALVGPILAMTGYDGFVCNTYGKSGSGKSVANCIGGSIWGSADSRRGFVLSADTTNTSWEIALDARNYLPLIIDDYNQLDEKEKPKFNKKIMQVANGQGKSRSNKTLGIQRPTSWMTGCLIGSEEPIRERGTTSGVPNRCLACQAPDEFPMEWRNEDGSLRAEELMTFFRDNYGWAGQDYIKIINELGKAGIKEIKQKKEKEIRKKAKEIGKNTTEKQIAALSILLTADEIAATRLFGDEIRISIGDALGFTEDAMVIDQSERFYETVIDLVYRNKQRFEGLSTMETISGEVLGAYVPRDGTIGISTSKMREWAEAYSVSLQMFLAHLKKTGRLVCEAGRNTKRTPLLDGSRPQMYQIKLPEGQEQEEQEEQKTQLMTPEDMRDLAQAYRDEAQQWAQAAQQAEQVQTEQMEIPFT